MGWNSAEISQQLGRCRSLDNPVREWFRVVKWAFFAFVLLLVALLAIEISNQFKREASLGGFLILTGFLAFVGTCWWVAMLPFNLKANDRRVLYLRAFKSDDTSLKMRALVRAGLPAHYVLEGIRQPQKRPPGLVRLFAEGLTAITFAGSEHFELEAADRNWLARLAASADGASAFVIDATEMTGNVRDEIKLALLVAGDRQCFILVKEHQDTEALAEQLAQVTELDLGNLEKVRWVRVPDHIDLNEEAFVKVCRKAFDELPPDPLQVGPEAVEFVRSNVSDENWATRWIETPTARVIGSFLILGLLVYLLPGVIGAILVFLIAVVFAAFYWIAQHRWWSTVKSDRRMGRNVAKDRRLLIASRICGGISVAIVLLLASIVPSMAATVLRQAQRTLTFSNLSGLQLGLRTYELEGYAPLLTGLEQDSIDLDGRNRIVDALLGTDPELNPRRRQFIQIPARQAEATAGIPYIHQPYLDAWQRPVRLNRDPVTGSWEQPSLQSAGPDGAFDTEDDLFVDWDGRRR